MVQATEGAATAAAPAPTGHSRFGASSAHRWTVCTGSIKAQEGLPNESSDYASEGTALHAVSSYCLENKQDAAEWIDRVFKYDDHGEAKEIELDEDQAEAVQVYLDAIRKDQAERGGKLLIETRFQLSDLNPEFFGTSDCCAIGTDDTLRVYDAKFGRGKIVEVCQPNGSPNLQLGFYALGALRALARVMEALKVRWVELVVVQPRAWHRDGPVRRQTFFLDVIEGLGPLFVAKATEAVENPQLIPGDHCTFCKAAGTCKALRDFALDTAQLDFDEEVGIMGGTVNPATLDGAALARVLEVADVLQTFVNAVRSRAHGLADSGHDIPGWALKESKGHRKWSDEAAAKSALCYDFGLDVSSIYVQKLKTPAQVEKLLPKPDRPKLADLLAERSTKTTLVRASNPDATAAPRVQSDFDDGRSDDSAEW
jgi:hypothetical protein